jgi:hypothetical protein
MNPNTKKMLMILAALVVLGVILNFAGAGLIAELKRMHHIQ